MNKIIEEVVLEKLGTWEKQFDSLKEEVNPVIKNKMLSKRVITLETQIQVATQTGEQRKKGL